MKRDISATTREIKIVDANGRNIFLPKRLNRTSPGKLPIPNRSNHGKSEENTINTRNMMINHRIIYDPIEVSAR